MTKVKMLVSIASPSWSYYPGEEVEIEDELAKVWDEIGHCKILRKTRSKESQNNNEGAGEANGTENDNPAGGGTADDSGGTEPAGA